MQSEIEIRERLVRLESAEEYARRIMQEHGQRVTNLNARVTNNELAIQNILRGKGDIKAKLACHGEAIRRHEMYVGKSLAIWAAAKYSAGGVLLWLLLTGRLTRDQLSALASLLGF